MPNPRRRWLTLSALSLISPVALAQGWDDGQDDGEYQILHARYGTAERNVDVTERLKDLARADRNFRVGNDSFGVDPDPGRRKTLRIFARARQGERQTFEYREGSRVDGNLFTGWRRGHGWGEGRGGWDDGDAGDDAGSYLILQAEYGTPKRHVDVTQRLRELAREDRRFRMGNETFGVDPDPGRRKLLRIFTRSRDGQERVFDYDEGAVIDGAQFMGWGQGQWGEGRTGRGWEDRDWGPSRPNRERRHLRVLEARYGLGSRVVDVTERLRAVLGRSEEGLAVSNELLGVDPAPHMRKTLWLRYQRGGETPREVQVREGDKLHLP